MSAVAGHSLETWRRAFPVKSAAAVLRLVPADTGVIERRNPLPAGTYWKDIFLDDSAAFNAWLAENRETVTIKTTEHFEKDPVSGYPSRDWVLFQVTVPTKWHGPGFPDVATPNVQTAADTAVRPDPIPDLSDQSDPFGLKKAGPWLVGGVAVVAAIALLK